MNAWDGARLFLLGVAVALLAVLALRPESGRAHAQSSMAAAGGIIAVGMPGTGSDSAAFVLVDTNRKTMAYYAARGNQGLRLRSARTYAYDLEIYETEKSGGMSVKDAEAEARKQSKMLR